MRLVRVEHQGDGPHAVRRLAIAALVVFAWVLAIPPHAHAAANMEVAVQDDPLFAGNDYFGRVKGIKQARQVGASRIRVNVSWTTVLSAKQARARKKPRKVVYNFGAYDGIVGATANGPIRVQLALVGPAPAWATGNKKIGPNRVNAKYFGEFVRATATHFNGLVDRYSIWNEPNYVGWLSPLSSAPRNYRAMYVEGYDAIKSVAPGAQVLIAETSPYAIKKRATAPLAFLRKMVCANRGFTKASCGGLVADGYAHHPYDFDHKPTYKFPGADNATINTLGRLTTALDRLASAGGLKSPSGKALDLYLTEYGYFRSGKRRVPESRRAKYLVQGFQIAQRNPRVREMLQYLLAQPAKKYRFFDTSILSSRGKTTKTFTALKKWAAGALRSGAIAPSAVIAQAGGSAGGGGSNPPSTGGGGSGGGGGTTPPPSGGGTPCTTTTPVALPPGCTP